MRNMIPHSNINVLLNLIIAQFFQNDRCLLILTEEGFNYHGGIPSVKIQIFNNTFDYKLIFHNFGCQGIVIYSGNSASVFSQFEIQIRLEHERFNNRKFLIVLDEDLEQDFFALDHLNFVCDLLVVLPKKSHEGFVIEFKTHKYVGVSNNNDPILLDRWFASNQPSLLSRNLNQKPGNSTSYKNVSIHTKYWELYRSEVDYRKHIDANFNFNEQISITSFTKNLYPDKMGNMKRRPLRMTTITYEPFAVFHETAGKLYGSEMTTSVTFGFKHNMTPVVVDAGDDYWGYISPNYTGKGILGNLAMDKADIGFAALYLWEHCYRYLDLSQFILRSGATLLVPAPRLAANWLTPLLSYTPKIWISVVVILTISIIIFTMMLALYNKSSVVQKEPKSNWLNFLELATIVATKPMIQQALTNAEIPTELSTKFIMVLILILSLFLTNIYSSGLAAVMTLPKYEGVIRTAADFASVDIEWGATDENWIMMIKHSSLPQDLRVVSKFHVLSKQQLRDHSKTGQFSFVLERLPYGSFGIEDFIQQDIIHSFDLIRDDLYWSYCVFMLRKNSVLLPSLNTLVLRIFESGIIQRWQNEAVALYMDNKVQSAVRYYSTHFHPDPVVIKLKCSHVGGIFFLLVIGWITSFICFCLEIASYRKKMKTTQLIKSH